ncbi:hypothetical protein ABIA35_001047 [Catenulispora sp. MAP12-49]|uniref:hypothetical protein n=1 Tax=Catenulispora sp. MAP12-49 TaxID=3156302 RepID=UPI0035135F8C
MKVYIYSNDTAETQLFEGQSTAGVQNRQLVVTAPTGTGGLTRNAKYKYSLTMPNHNVAVATLTAVNGTTYTFSV